MDRLEQIQDEIAQSMGFKNMDSVDPYANFPELDRIYNLSAKQYAKECVEASLQKAYQNSIGCCKECKSDGIEINYESIINNILLI